jgi:hypothetical protein
MRIYVAELGGIVIAGQGFCSQQDAEKALDERPIHELVAAWVGRSSMIERTYAVRPATSQEADIWIRTRADFARGDYLLLHANPLLFFASVETS